MAVTPRPRIPLIAVAPFSGHCSPGDQRARVPSTFPWGLRLSADTCCPAVPAGGRALPEGLRASTQCLPGQERGGQSGQDTKGP